jgi:P pilus assembly chaperone PapD
MRLSLLAALALLLAAPTLRAQAQPAPAAPAPTVTAVGANLNISPKRVTFDKNRRSATVYIYNQGTAPATFDVALVDRVMLPDGQIVAADEAATKPDQKPYVDRLKSAAHILLVSPRRVTLAPGEGQTVRMRVTSVPADATGEYRSHLTVTTIPPPSAGLTAEQAAAGGQNQISFQITSVFGISIPAIVRFSDPDVRASIQNAHLTHENLSLDGKAPKSTPVMVFDLVRDGSSSLFGNIDIRPVGQKGGAPLGFVRGLGVYPEIDKRTVRIPLTREPRPGEKLEITFTDDDTSPGKLLAKLDM